MTNKSITKKDLKHGRKEMCPQANKAIRGNSPGWYTVEQLPYKGENFNALGSIRPQPGVMYENGVATNVAMIHFTVLHPPVDEFDSFYKKAADFYAEIRERNSGAANYTVTHLASYMWNVSVLHSLCHAMARAIKSVKSVLVASADSPYLLTALTAIRNYEDVASRLAVLTNRYTILAKDIENLPLPHITAHDRARFLYGAYFADSRTQKPSLLSFLPGTVIKMSWTNAASATPEYISTDLDTGSSWLDNALEFCGELLNEITTNNIYTIIRGDVRNAFGNAAYWDGLVQLPATPLQLIAEDVEVMSQLENLSMIPRDYDAAKEVVYEYSEADKQFVVRFEIDGINDSPSLSRLWCDNNLVNFHGDSLSDGELLAITRMMYVGRKENRLTKTDACILASSGDTVYYTYVPVGFTNTSVSYESLSGMLMVAQTSTVQSSQMSRAMELSFIASVLDHAPMIIWGDSDRFGMLYQWDLDNYAVMSNLNLRNMTVIANRSLYDIHLPRGESGRLEKKA